MKNHKEVYLDRTLAFTIETEEVTKKANKKYRILGAVKNTQYGWKNKDMTKVYTNHIRSAMDYAAQAWKPQ